MSQPYDRYPGPPPYGGWPPAAPPGPPPAGWPPPGPYGGYGPPQPRRRNRAVVAWTVVGVVLGLVLLGVIGVGAFRLGSTGFTDLPAIETTEPADWAGIGGDEGLDPYAQRCHDGELDACDELYSLSDPGSDYQYYALTCGGRVQPRDVVACILLE